MTSDDAEILAQAQLGFLDEARQMLRQFEEGLLAMEQDPADGEATNAAFRAAHTIKGTAGLFGFTEVVAFTHEVESVLDAVRDGHLQPDDALMGLLLRSRDQMEALLESLDGPLPAPVADEGRTLAEALRQRLSSADAAEGAVCAAAPAAAAQPVAAASRAWHLSLRAGREALLNGLDPLSFIRYLGQQATLGGIRTLAEQVPALDELNPEACHLGFEIALSSAQDRAAIEDVFTFLMDDADLVLVGPDPQPADYASLLQHRCGDDDSAREALLAHWQALAGPGAAPLVERRAPEAPAERRANEPERRSGGRERRGGDDARFIRVRADKLDRLIDLIGELVIAGSSAQLVAQQEKSARFGEAAQRIHDLVQEARDGALGLRMVPIGETFTRFQRVVRDVSKQLGKDVELQVTGGDTELDKSMVETLADPLMHLVRNSLDHGLETAEQRAAAGKPAQGRLALHAYHESGSILIEVSDDGRGLNRERIVAKALERGLIPPDAQLSDDEAYQLIFLPGFSTAEQVTNLSGRGVGMDVVKRNVESLRGQIRVASQPGRGATVQIRLPLTLAIIDGFLTSVAGVSYVVPLEVVAECIEIPRECRFADETSAVCGTFDLRGEVVPFIDLRRCYGHGGARPARQSFVVVRGASGLLGLCVDRLHGEYQTVIKPLAGIFGQLPGIAGSTILGSGEVALILDVAALEQGQVQRAARLAGPAALPAEAPAAPAA